MWIIAAAILTILLALAGEVRPADRPPSSNGKLVRRGSTSSIRSIGGGALKRVISGLGLNGLRDKSPPSQTKPSDVIDLNLRIFPDEFGPVGFERIKDITNYVHVYKHKTSGVLCVVKRNSEDMTVAQLDHERMALVRLDNGQQCSPFIERFYRFYMADHSAQLLVEYAERDNLQKLVTSKKLQRQDRRDVVAQLVLAVEYIHAEGLIHGYLHPSNIMRCRNSGRIILTNFRYASLRFGSNDTELAHRRGKYGVPMSSFVAPEVQMSGRPNSGVFSDRMADIYSLGANIYYIYCGTEFESWDKVCAELWPSGPNRRSSLKGRSPSESVTLTHEAALALALIRLLMNDEPTKRPGYGQPNLNVIKRHSYFGNIDYFAAIEQHYREQQAAGTPKALIHRPTSNGRESVLSVGELRRPWNQSLKKVLSALSAGFSNKSGPFPKPSVSVPDVRSLNLKIFPSNFNKENEDFVFVRRLTNGVELYSLEASDVLCAVRRASSNLLINKLLTEYDALRHLDNGHRCSPFIVRFYALYQHDSKDNRPLRLLMEHKKGDNLHNLVAAKKIKRQDYRKIVMQLVLAVEYIHAKGMIHGYLDPMNVMIWEDSGRVVLTNFRHAKPRFGRDGKELFHSYDPDKDMQPSSYMAPEVTQSGVANALVRYTKMADVYSLGAVIYYLYCGSAFISWLKVCPELKPPLKRRESAKKKSSAYDEASLALDLIRRLMTVTPSDRPSFRQENLDDIKQHPYFENAEMFKMIESLYRYVQALETPAALIRPSIE